MRNAFDVVVVGSGAGGGVVAGDLARRGRDVLLLETGSHYRAPDFMRWESKAAHDLFWPLGSPLAERDLVTFRRRALRRRHDDDQHQGRFPCSRARHREVASRRRPDERREHAFSVSDLQPYYDVVERDLGVRERSDWKKSVYTVEPGFRALGAELEAVNAYTDANCTSCGSCIQGCPSNAGKSTMNTYIADALAQGALELRANSTVERVLIEGSEATGVEYVDADGQRTR
jgi:choline dehydrogenase-like flavoprotein